MSATAYPTELKGPYFKVVPHSATSTLVVVFSPVNVQPGVYSMWKTMDGQRVHLLFVNDKDNGWYQQGIEGLGTSIEDTAATIRRWADALGASEIVTLGNSMGGYGALLYGAHLNCRALAFGAETVLRLPGSRSALLMPKALKARFPNLRDALAKSKTQATLCIGEADLTDLVAGKNVSGLPNVDVISVRGVGHAAPDFLGGLFGFHAVIRTYLKTGKLPEFKERGDLCEKKETVDLLWQAQLASYRRDWPVAEALLSAALAMSPSSEIVHHRLGVALHEQGHFARAVAHQSYAVQVTPHFGTAQHYLGLALRHFGEYQAAAAAQRAATTINAQHAAAFFQLGEIEAALGNLDAARAALTKASALDGKSQLYAERLKSLTPSEKLAA